MKNRVFLLASMDKPGKLTPGKYYEHIADIGTNSVAVIDDTGNNNVYTKNHFAPLTLNEYMSRSSLRRKPTLPNPGTFRF